MLTKISALLSVIGSLYETGEKIITKGKELLFGKEEVSPERVINHMSSQEKIQYDTTFKMYTKDEIVSECLTKVRQELFMSLSLEEVYFMVVVSLSKIVRKLLEISPIKIGGCVNVIVESKSEGEDTEDKGSKYLIYDGYEIWIWICKWNV